MCIVIICTELAENKYVKKSPFIFFHKFLNIFTLTYYF